MLFPDLLRHRKEGSEHPAPHSGPAWHPYSVPADFGQIFRGSPFQPASLDTPGSCKPSETQFAQRGPGPASLQPCRPSSAVPSSSITWSLSACPLLRFPPLRLSQRKAFRRPETETASSPGRFRIVFRHQIHTSFKVSQSLSFLETQARPVAGVEGFSSPSPGIPDPTGLGRGGVAGVRSAGRPDTCRGRARSL